jgi:hypothetical protein
MRAVGRAAFRALLSVRGWHSVQLADRKKEWLRNNTEEVKGKK